MYFVEMRESITVIISYINKVCIFCIRNKDDPRMIVDHFIYMHDFIKVWNLVLCPFLSFTYAYVVDHYAKTR